MAYSAMTTFEQPTTPANNRAALIVGCGDIGRRVAARCQEQHQAVSGIVRRQTQMLIDAGIGAITADLDSPATCHSLPTAGTELYYFAPPPAEGKTDPRMTVLLQRLDAAPPAKLVYISTPGVYGDCQSRWIDEDEPIDPLSDRGHRRANAEQQLLMWSENTGTPLVILRVPGIYGANRLPRARLEKGIPVINVKASPFTNRIHEDDLAMVCYQAMQRAPVSGKQQMVLHASDGNPSKMTEYFLHCADALGLPQPEQISREQAEEQLSAGMLIYLRESKRLKNGRLLKELGVTLKYKDLNAGLAEMRLSEQSAEKSATK